MCWDKDDGGRRGGILGVPCCVFFHFRFVRLRVNTNNPKLNSDTEKEYNNKGHGTGIREIHAKIQQLYPSRECCRNSSPRTSYNLSCPA